MNKQTSITIYFLSGLGADKRTYQKLQLPNQFKKIYIDWIQPLIDEPLHDYSLRLSKQINTSQPFILIGLSFGGIIATELNKIIEPLCTILISSASTCEEIPWYYKLAGKLQLPKFVPTRILKMANPISYWFFGVSSKEEKKLLKDILTETDSLFLKWALIKISGWKNTQKPKNLFHIHGNADKILPRKFTRPDVIVEYGKHLMVYSKAEEISKVIIEKIYSL